VTQHKDSLHGQNYNTNKRMFSYNLFHKDNVVIQSNGLILSIAADSEAKVVVGKSRTSQAGNGCMKYFLASTGSVHFFLATEWLFSCAPQRIHASSALED